jgi:glycogen(starch) synthase
MKKISVVINTLNRGHVLRNTLNSLRIQEYKNFEVVVVNGPSTDNTKYILEDFRQDIKVVSCLKANLSMSRNLGIQASSGDIVVFIDDDACVTSDFLGTILSGYSDETIGGVGTLVYGPNGVDYQQVPFFVDKLAEPNWGYGRHRADLFYPEMKIFGHQVGCSSSFRRDLLLQIGGFDERIEYFLDETDVCFELHKKGYSIIIVGETPKVFHYWASAAHRNEQRVILSPQKIIENKYYFAIKSADTIDKKIAIEQCDNYSKKHIDEAKLHLKEGRMNELQFANFSKEVIGGRKLGITKSQLKRAERKFKSSPELFKPYKTANEPDKLKKVTLISRRDFRVANNGIALFTLNLARTLSNSGVEVRVITEGNEKAIEYYENFWVHTIQNPTPTYETQILKSDIAKELVGWSINALNEVESIEREYGVNVISAPIWDLEGISIALNKKYKFILSLHTNFHEYFKLNPGIRADIEVEELKRLEKVYVSESHGIHANSQAICNQIFHDLGIDLGNLKKFNTQVIPHGMRVSNDVQKLINLKKPQSAKKRFSVGFVGRLEERKGFDIFLDFAVYAKEKKLPYDFHVIGADTEIRGESFLANLLKSRDIKDIKKYVNYYGFLPEDEKFKTMLTFDAMLLPSKFESFGYVYVEAMACGLPVVCMSLGAAPEVVQDGETGILLKDASPSSIENALFKIFKTRDSYLNFSKNAKGYFDTAFTLNSWGERLKNLY